MTGRFVRGSWRRVFGIVALASAIGACGSPAGPGAVTVAGTWAGTWQFVTAGVTVTDTVTATLTQSGSSVSGTWSGQSGASGQLAFTNGASISGSLTLIHMLLTGQTCSATTALSGTASATTLDFTLSDVAPAGLCQWATMNHFLLTKS